jgi:hypothetical protein
MVENRVFMRFNSIYADRQLEKSFNEFTDLCDSFGMFCCGDARDFAGRFRIRGIALERVHNIPWLRLRNGADEVQLRPDGIGNNDLLMCYGNILGYRAVSNALFKRVLQDACRREAVVVLLSHRQFSR